jgi:hypothetical protein
MSESASVRKIIFLSIILLISSLSPMFIDSSTLESEKTLQVSQIVDVSTFSSGSSTETIMADMGGIATINHQAGFRLLNASVAIETLPYSTTQTQYQNMINAQSLGTLNNTSVTPTGVELTNANTGPPGSGNNSTTILNAVQWSGTQYLQHLMDTAMAAAVLAMAVVEAVVVEALEQVGPHMAILPKRVHKVAQ